MDGERKESSSENGMLVAVLALALIGATLYLLVARLYIRPAQLVEAGLYLLIMITAVAVPISWKIHDPGIRKKRDPFVMPRRRDRKFVAAAWKNHSVLLGYDMNFKPWMWSDRVRTMQSVVVGMSGSGKTTLLENIATQDIARWIGTPENPKRVPMIIFDGKGDLEFFHRLLPHVHRAGRLEQLRLLNPSQPDLSSLYNPFYAPDGDYMANVGMIFGSFNLNDEFFAKHQLNYLGDVVRVLYYTGARYNFYDVIVMLLDEVVMSEQIEKAKAVMERDSGVSTEQRLNFEMSVKNLIKSLSDRERIPKIQGLVNECMTFLDDDLSQVTGQYEDLLSIDQVIDEQLILFVSLNINKKTEAVRSLGKMMLQNIQLCVGKRYESADSAKRGGHGFFSIILDEFSPFGYRNFSRILNTARGAETAFLFSLQSLPQLAEVGRGFAEDISSAPNTTISARTRDETTADYFIKASAEHIVTKRSVAKERGFFGLGKYQETGRATESEQRETRSQDESIKNLPKGMVEILMSDDTEGTRHGKLMIRPPDDVTIPGFTPTLFPRLIHSIADSKGANLRFKQATRKDEFHVPNREKLHMGGFQK